MIHRSFRTLLISSSLIAIAACTGLVAGPVQPASSSALQGVSADSAYRRARSQLGTEVFSIIEQDSVHRWIKATRFPKYPVAVNSPESCRLHLRVDVASDQVSTTGQWTADAASTTDQGTAACDKELESVESRVQQFASNTP